MPSNADTWYRWLYTLFLAVDVNFRSGLKDKGIHDPELAPGWAYFVEESRYQAHLKNHLDQEEVIRILFHILHVTNFHLQINTCKSQHDAILRANTRNKEGYIASGTGLVQCRHVLVRKNGVGDLQKGEK